MQHINNTLSAILRVTLALTGVFALSTAQAGGAEAKTTEAKTTAKTTSKTTASSKIKFQQHVHCHTHTHKHDKKPHGHRHCHKHAHFYTNPKHAYKRDISIHNVFAHKHSHGGADKKAADAKTPAKTKTADAKKAAAETKK